MTLVMVALMSTVFVRELRLIRWDADATPPSLPAPPPTPLVGPIAA